MSARARTVAWVLLAGMVATCCRGLWAAAPPARIISLVPAVTEMLFAVGAGPQVVAVSSYDRNPPEVERLPRVGALLDPDLERVLSLRPDLVAIYGSQQELAAKLRATGIRTLPYRHGGLADVLTTIEQVGRETGHAEEAARVASGISRQIDAIRGRVAGLGRPRVLLVFGREPGTLRGIYASGGVGFMSDLIAVAGGVNVFADVARESVQAGTELILTRRPDVIVELRADPMPPAELERERHAWSVLAAVPAVQAGRIVFLTGSEMVVPGPRIAIAAERLARGIHPEVQR